MIKYKMKKNLDDNIINLVKITKIYSFIRLILAITTIVFVVCFMSLEDYLLYAILSIGNIAILMIVIILTNPKYHELKILKNLEYVYKRHDNRRNGSYSSFSDDGREFIDYEDYKELDIDLLGPKSLYQYLCVAKTKIGRLKLANQLKNPEPKSKEFRNCVYTFANDENSFLLEASLLNISSDTNSCDYNELLNVSSKKIKLPVISWVLMIMSYLSLITLFIILIINKITPLYCLFFIIINFIIARKFGDNEVFSINSTKYASLLDGYEILSKDILNSKIDDPYFNELKSVIKDEIESISLLKKTFDMLSYRRNIIFSIIFNGLFFIDYWIDIRFNHINKKISSIEDSISAIAEIELILSLATIGIDNDEYCVGEDGNELYMEDGYHPLVKNCVTNSFVLAGGVILTGSNMAGKTTFQRTIGINQILYNAGGLICAKYFSSRNLEIVTSLRANDMLQEGISTFYAEIKRMKKIVENVNKSKDTLVLIDEIFKGTNAKDRIFGSLEIIKKLNSAKVLFIITTHDFEICEASNILNYHFSEDYIDDKIKFDYKIKEGKCKSTNARYLLKMSGIIE